MIIGLVLHCPVKTDRFCLLYCIHFWSACSWFCGKCWKSLGRTKKTRLVHKSMKKTSSVVYLCIASFSILYKSTGAFNREYPPVAGEMSGN
jgi:hypothetical protein